MSFGQQNETSKSLSLSSSSSSGRPPLHSHALDEFANGLDTVSMAVLANPAKLQETIRELSSQEKNPNAFGDNNAQIQTNDEPAAIDDDVMEDEKMHVSDIHPSAEDNLMQKMETAGFNQTKSISGGNNTNGGGVGAANSISKNRFVNIPQPSPDAYDQAIDGDDNADNDPMNRATFQQSMRETDTYHDRFTAPQSDLEASGINNAGGAAKTQSVYINTDKNVTNTFDNTIYATQANSAFRRENTTPTAPQNPPLATPPSVAAALADDHEKSTSTAPSLSSTTTAPTESDATAYKQIVRERQRQQRKKERRRRERLPHERTVGDMQEERYEDWERKIQQDVKEEENNEKREFLLLFAEKEQEGYKMLRQFNMNSNLNEMRFWYYKLLRDARTDDEVAHLRSHLVEGTRMLLYLNENIFQNPLGLSDMGEFPDALSSMLVGTWDRHIRDYVKNKNGLQGPPAQPLRNLGLNFLHLFISHHRKKAGEEQKEKQQREAAQRDAMLQAATKNSSGIALNPFEAIFGGATSHMRGAEGINPMELPHYANVSTVPIPATAPSNNSDFQEFLQLKRAREEEEYKLFLDRKYGRQQKPTVQKPAPTTASLLVQPTLPRGIPPQPPTGVTASFAKKHTTLPPASFLADRGGGSPLPNDLGPPDVASIDANVATFPAPASQSKREQLATSNKNAAASNSRLVGEKNATKHDNGDDEESKLLLSTSFAASASSSSGSKSISNSGSNKLLAKKQPPPTSPPTPPPPPQQLKNTLPPAYLQEHPGSQLLKNIGRKGGITDERVVPLPPVPDISRENIQRLQQRLAKQKEERLAAPPTTTATKSATGKSNTVGIAAASARNLKTLRPVDRERVAKLLATSAKKPSETTLKQQTIPPSSIESSASEKKDGERNNDSSHDRDGSIINSSSASTVEQTNHSDSFLSPKSVVSVVKKLKTDPNDYDAILAQMEAECDALDEDEDLIRQYDDVRAVPKNASEMDNHKNDNRILDMLTMFEKFMSGPPKGTRPTAQTSMFSNIDNLLETNNNATTEIRSSKRSNNNSSSSGGGGGSGGGRRRKRVQIRNQTDDDDDETDEASIATNSNRGESKSSNNNPSSSASFRVNSDNKSEMMADYMDSRGRFVV